MQKLARKEDGFAQQDLVRAGRWKQKGGLLQYCSI